MNAITVRNLLIAGLFLATAAIGALIYFASDYVRAEAVTTLHTKIDTQLIEQDITRLQSLEKVLEANQASVAKAAQIVSDSKQYQYQDQIVSDINAFAAASGVNVVGYDFGSVTTRVAPSATPNSAPQISGIKSIPVTLTLSSPMPFDNYLRFIKHIEQNLTKMQVSGINISPDSKDVQQIINPSVVLIVYVR